MKNKFILLLKFKMEAQILSNRATVRDKNGYTLARGVTVKKYKTQISLNEVIYPISRFKFIDDDKKLVDTENGWEAELQD